MPANLERRRREGPFDRGGAADILIGVQARRERLRRLALSLGGVALILAAVVVYRALSPARPPLAGPPTVAKLRCQSCGAIETRTVGQTSVEPHACAACGMNTCYELWRCLRCGNEFVPPPADGLRTCDRCGSTQAGSAAAAAAR